MTDRPDLVTQPDATPTRKTAAAGATGLVIALVVLIAGAAGIDVPGVEADGIVDALGPAVAVLAPAVAAYLTRDRRPS